MSRQLTKPEIIEAIILTMQEGIEICGSLPPKEGRALRNYRVAQKRMIEELLEQLPAAELKLFAERHHLNCLANIYTQVE